MKNAFAVIELDIGYRLMRNHKFTFTVYHDLVIERRDRK